jgi:Arc/MetJ family transcription regulator
MPGRLVAAIFSPGFLAKSLQSWLNGCRGGCLKVTAVKTAEGQPFSQVRNYPVRQPLIWSRIALNTASIDAIFDAGVLETNVRTTIALDDDLLAKAQAFTGLSEKSALVREALKALIERESARRLARLGGTEKKLSAPPRRRP